MPQHQRLQHLLRVLVRLMRFGILLGNEEACFLAVEVVISAEHLLVSPNDNNPEGNLSLFVPGDVLSNSFKPADLPQGREPGGSQNLVILGQQDARAACSTRSSMVGAPWNCAPNCASCLVLFAFKGSA